MGLNILVTGCGGDIGQSIGKILKSTSLFNNVVGCDITDEHAGKFIFDRTFVSKRCTSPDYLGHLEELVKGNNIDIILPISEAELRFFSGKRFDRQIFGIPMITANLLAMDTGFDKLATAEFLRDSGYAYPETCLVQTLEKPSLPIILKSRDGAGSKQIYLVNDLEAFAFYKKLHPEFIAQQYLPDINEEYTCGLFRSKTGIIRTIVFRRKLSGGFSNFGIVCEEKAIDHLLTGIGRDLDLRGSINVQLRVSEGVPYVFEINPRFSSTVLFRHLLNFQDVIWSIQDVLGKEISDYFPPVIGTKFYKGFHEYID